MLSFMCDRTNGSKQLDRTTGSENSGTEPDSGQQQEYLTVSSKQKQVRQSTYLLVGLFAVGLFVLFFMIKKSTPSSAAASGLSGNNPEQLQIETAISKLTGVRTQIFSGLEKIVKKFYEFSDFEQVDVDELKKNPFKIDDDSGNLTDINSDNDTLLLAAQNELELLSIMSSERGNCCMIDNQILYEGDTIKGFKISKITDNDVELIAGDSRILLKLNDAY